MSKVYNGFTGSQRAAGGAWLKKAMASGEMPAATECEACGQTGGPLDRHAEDYSVPHGWHTGEYELCYVCHLVLHCRDSKGGSMPAFARYVEWLETSGSRVAVVGRNFKVVCALYGWEGSGWTEYGPPREVPIEPRTLFGPAGLLRDLLDGTVHRRPSQLNVQEVLA